MSSLIYEHPFLRIHCLLNIQQLYALQVLFEMYLWVFLVQDTLSKTKWT